MLLVSAVACKKSVKQDVISKNDAMQKTTTDPAVDSVGKDLNNVDAVDKDLSDDQLSDVDSGLSDVENI